MIAACALGACLAVLAVAAPGTAQRPSPGTPAAKRALLLDPSDPFWQAHAPAQFRAEVRTSRGTFVLEVHRDWAPFGVDHFYNLARAGYFDDSRFFRVLPKYIAQFGIAGDPAITAVWKERTIPDDSVRESNVRGTFGFAMTGPGTRTTQLYISLKANPQLDAQGFSVLGRVVEGMAVVDSLYDGYGESAGGGVRVGRQHRMLSEGNAHLDRDFPKLDRLVGVTIR